MTLLPRLHRRVLARVSWIARRELLSPQLRAGVCVKLV